MMEEYEVIDPPQGRYETRVIFCVMPVIGGGLCTLGLVFLLGQLAGGWDSNNAGYWAGGMCIVTGIAGIFAGWFKNKASVIILLIFNILCMIPLCVMPALLIVKSQGFIIFLVAVAMIANVASIMLPCSILCPNEETCQSRHTHRDYRHTEKPQNTQYNAI